MLSFLYLFFKFINDAKIPGEIDKENEDKQILRFGITAELDAYHFV
jgi:hypothetical protein